MVTGVNGAKSTQQTGSAARTEETQKDKALLKTFLALIFTISAANNHNSTLSAASRYAGAAGQAMLLINNDQAHHLSPFHGFGEVAERLVDGFLDDSRKKAPEPVSLGDRLAEVQDLRHQADSKEAQMKSEITEVAAELDIETKDINAKKADKKQRKEDFETAIKEIKEQKRLAKQELLNAQINGDTRAETKARKDITLHEIQERVFTSIPKEKRATKGILEKAKETSEEISSQLAYYDTAKQKVEKRKGNILKRPFTRKSRAQEQERIIQSRQRAQTEITSSIASLRKDLGLQSDRQLGTLINSYLAA